MKRLGRVCFGNEGFDQGWWVLLDFGSVLVHLMREDARQYYDLESLWADGNVVRRSADVEVAQRPE